MLIFKSLKKFKNLYNPFRPNVLGLFCTHNNKNKIHSLRPKFNVPYPLEESEHKMKGIELSQENLDTFAGFL